MPDGTILCTMNVAGLYPNIPHGKVLCFAVISDNLTELEELVLKNNIFEFDPKSFKQKRGTHFAPSYAIAFMTDCEKNMLKFFEKKPMILLRYVDDLLFILDHGEESSKVLIKQVNMFHTTIKFTAEYSKEEVHFVDVNMKLIHGKLKRHLLAKSTDTHQLFFFFSLSKSYITLTNKLINLRFKE